MNKLTNLNLHKKLKIKLPKRELGGLISATIDTATKNHLEKSYCRKFHHIPSKAPFMRPLLNRAASLSTSPPMFSWKFPKQILHQARVTRALDCKAFINGHTFTQLLNLFIRPIVQAVLLGKIKNCTAFLHYYR